MNLENMISPVIKNMPPSGIRKFFDLVNEMKDAISLSIGEPDFDTPWRVRESGIYSLEQGHTMYTSNAGLKELRDEISNYILKKQNVKYDPNNEIIVTVGGSEAIDLAMRALICPGDEVLLPEPSFVSYKPCAQMAGAKVVTIPLRQEDQFRLTPELLREKITERTKILVLAFPNNPTGAIMEREDLEKIAEVLKDTNIIVLSDEIYSELSYGVKHTSIINIPGMKERTLMINGFSKAYAMTGWRLGYVCGEPAIIGPMLKIHQFAIMSSPTTAQHAAIEALRNADEDVSEMVREYNRRRRVMLSAFRNMGLECFEAMGAFYIFPNIKSTGLSSAEFCEKLLMQERVAVVPGSAFGESGEGYVRVCYAASMENINEAMKRIEKFIMNLQMKSI